MAGAYRDLRVGVTTDCSMVVRPDPPVALEPPAAAGPVVVRTIYSIPAERELEFIRAMGEVRESRLRTGATQWDCFVTASSRASLRRSLWSLPGTSTCASTGSG